MPHFTPALIDVILIGVIVEFIALSALLWRFGEASWIAPLGLFLSAGALLMAALRASLAGEGDAAIGAAMLAALAAHGLFLGVMAMRIARSASAAPIRRARRDVANLGLTTD